MKELEMHNGDVRDAAECDHDWREYYLAGRADPIRWECRKCGTERRTDPNA